MIKLPDSLDACHTLIEQTNDTNESLAKDLERIKFEYEQLKRYIYGRRSERHVEDDSQLSLFDESEEVANSDADANEKVIEITYERRQRSKKARFPESLPREVEVIDVPEAERLCTCCGDEMPIIATDIRERLEYVPAQMLVHELHYPKRACSKCKTGVTVAPPPQSNEKNAALTAGSRYGFGVTSQIILGKYADHLPLYRLEDVFARAGRGDSSQYASRLAQRRCRLTSSAHRHD